MPGSKQKSTLGSSFARRLYDAVGNLEVQDDAGGELSGLFDYDASNRLRVELTGAPRFYDYDPDGNLVLPGFAYEDPQPHALSSDGTFAYDYDDAGRRHLKRRADGSGQRIEYTRFDLPRQVHRLAAGGTIASTVAFSYDANGSRVRKRSPDEEVTYSGGFEYKRFFDGRPAEQVFYVGNGREAIAQVTAKPSAAPSTAYLHKSSLGTVAAVEENGATRTIRQDAFGMPISVDGSSNPWNSPTRVGFTGHETDSELELINMSGRIYDPRARQFLTTDPIVVAPFSALDLNPYAYAWGNPLKFIDPSGLQESISPEIADTIASYPDDVSIRWIQFGGPMAGTSGSPTSDAVSSPLGSEGFGDRAPVDPLENSPLSPTQLGGQISNHEAEVLAAHRATTNPYGHINGWGAADHQAAADTNARMWSEYLIGSATGVATEGLGLFGSRTLRMIPGTGRFFAWVEAKVAAGLSRSAASRAVGAAPKLSSISAINPTGCSTNCVNAAIAVERTLAGAGTSAAPGVAVAEAEVAAALGAHFGRALPSFSAAGRAELSSAMGAMGDGTRAIIVGMRANGTGHAFNGVMQNGRLVLLDGQSGTTASLAGYTSLRAFVTNF